MELDLKKIPNDIPHTIYDWAELNATSNKHFVSVLSYRCGEIVERTFAIRRYKNKGVAITEVRRRATGEINVFFKNLTYGMAGYNPVFERKDIISKSGGWGLKIFDKKWFDYWDIATMPLNFDCLCLNPEIITEVEEFKYCGYSGGDVIEYLNKYRKNPLIEFFGKCGLPISSSIITMATKDKKFRSFIAKNTVAVRTYGPKATKYAYQHNMSIKDAAKKLNDRRMALRHIPKMRGTKLDFERIIDWCDEKTIDYSLYNDYIEAVIELKLDLEDTKNIYPKNFKVMHDLRINEYESLKAKRDRKERKALYKAFSNAGKKAKTYEISDKGLSIIAPQDISELKREGQLLGHCVGKMGYDKKMADGKIVIMFVRQTEEINKPYVTIEYDLERNRLLQAYGKSNSKPNAEVVNFINSWVRMMKNLKTTT